MAFEKKEGIRKGGWRWDEGARGGGGGEQEEEEWGERGARKRARTHGPLENPGHIMPKPGRILTRDDIFQVPRNQPPGLSLPSPSTDNAERNIYARTLECFSKALCQLKGDPAQCYSSTTVPLYKS